MTTENTIIPKGPINRVERFEDFYRLYAKVPGIFKYMEQINDLYASGENTLFILYEDLLTHDPVIADMLKHDPEALLKDALKAFKNTLKFTGRKLEMKYSVRFFTKDKKSPLHIPIREFRAEHIDTFIWTEGIVIRSTGIRPKLVKAIFNCSRCGAEFEVIQLTPQIKWPKFCVGEKCNAKAQSEFRLITKKSEFIDWQTITIQEAPESVSTKGIPRSIQAILKNTLVDSVIPGDRVKLMGTFKSIIATAINHINSNIFNTFIEVNFIEPEDKDSENFLLSQADKKQIIELSKQPDIQRKIAGTIAPTIYGRDDLKMACALSLFSGRKKLKPSGKFIRGDIHILFVGDPGTGKSAILTSAIDISPRGMYTSGKGSSAVGLTAAVIKDEKDWTLEAGAIVLANGGVCGIDELDKMDKSDTSALHEGMAQQTITIAKANIRATLKSQTGIIAAANPHTGRYDRYKTPTQNIKLPPSLISRFDLIFVIIDKPEGEEDKKVAEFVLNRSMRPEDVQSEEGMTTPIEPSLLKKYISYAKKNCFPFISPKVKEQILDFYLQLRGKYDSEDAIISILARNLEGLIRLCEAHAKMALRDTVLQEDFDAIIKLYNRYLKDIGYDEATGKIDMDRLFVGESRSKLKKLEKLMEKIREMFEENNWRELERKSIVQILELDMERNFIDDALDQLIKEGTLYCPKPNHIRFSKQPE